MSNDTNIKSRFFGPNAGNTQITASSDTNLAAEQDPADGADLTLTTAAGNEFNLWSRILTTSKISFRNW